MKVADLFIPFTREWDCELIEEYFCEKDRAEITKIPLPLDESDFRIWSHSKDGSYTVRSGYHLAMNSIYTGRGNATSGAWHHVWDLNIPPKVKTFVWRTVRNCLPTRSNLQSRHVFVPSTCVNCDSAIEQSWHLFYTCPFAQACWDLSCVQYAIYSVPLEIENFAEWFFHMMGRLDVKERSAFVMILWGIWHSRNERLWNKTSPSAHWTITYATNSLSDWLAVRTIDSQQRQQQAQRQNIVWRRPTEEFDKCNVDAGFATDKKSFVVGMLIRDSNGFFIICRTSYHHGAALVKEAEALVIYEALSWIKDLGYDKVIVETDSKTSVDAIHSETQDVTEFGLTISMCRSFIRHESFFKIAHVRRQANRAVHTLVKTALHHACFGISDIIPISISNIILDDCNSSV